MDPTPGASGCMMEEAGFSETPPGEVTINMRPVQMAQPSKAKVLFKQLLSQQVHFLHGIKQAVYSVRHNCEQFILEARNSGPFNPDV